ncbi:MAG: quinohemoprotein amine dehydrogenase subunit alpha [Planctomycetes bacterium]|nr:quinohemoprotein amine dehydrogenase subunit alpha [Planctomycetota bacterium]
MQIHPALSRTFALVSSLLLVLAAVTAQRPTGGPPRAEAAQAPSATGEGAASEAQDGDRAQQRKKKKEKPGIPVDDVLVQSLCGRCHTRDDREHMTRISYVRKSPEGWARTIKRMGRLHGLQLTPTTAKSLVRSLSNSHGLTRGEAERGLYDSERRVHWSEEHHEDDFKRACAQCHPLGRVLLQYRDKEEWQLLRATHVAMFPLSQRQVGGGPPRESSRRSSPQGSASSGSSGASGNTPTGNNDGNSRRSRGNVGDRVLDKLSKEQPLFTPDWEKWTHNRREVPLAGTWTVTGHETGRGDVWGTYELTRTDADSYDGVWTLQWSDGSSARRVSKGILYAGYSWRGRATADGTSWREVLLLDERWQSFRGRLFSGAYDEIGVDVTLHRDDGRPRLVATRHGALEVPSRGHTLQVLASSTLPATLTVADFFAGDGVSITAVQRLDDRRASLTVDVAAGARLGARTVAFGDDPIGVPVTLYDTVDYVRVRPLQGLSRVGGAKHPRQLERFEAYAVHRGKDGKPYTDDDVDLFQVRPKWSLQEFRVRDDDDDLAYVGSIDPQTGVFTPNVDGPNPARKWQANNVGDVFVCCEIELDVPLRPPEKKAPDQDGEAGGDAEAGGDPEPAADAPDEAEPAAVAAMPARETRRFFARSHLLVTVPIYARWQVLDWEDR